jgi:hypothetical protein
LRVKIATMVKAATFRLEHTLIASGYVAAVGIGAMLIYTRLMWEAAHPEEVMESSGMFAFGDMLLYMFAGLLLLVPTFFLVRMLSRSERTGITSARVLLAVALSAPLSLILMLLGQDMIPGALLAGAFMRLEWSPLVFVFLLGSRLLARFSPAQRLLSYALLAEVMAILIAIAILLFASSSARI